MDDITYRLLAIGNMNVYITLEIGETHCIYFPDLSFKLNSTPPPKWLAFFCAKKDLFFSWFWSRQFPGRCGKVDFDLQTFDQRFQWTLDGNWEICIGLRVSWTDEGSIYKKIYIVLFIYIYIWYIYVVLYVFIIELNSLKIQDHTVIIYPVFP